MSTTSPGGAVTLPGALLSAGGLAAGVSPAIATGFVGPLVPGNPLDILLTPAAAGTASPTHGDGQRPRRSGTQPTRPVATPPTVFERIERVIPGFVWIAIAASLGLAAVGAASAFRSSRRSRMQAGAFAAVTAAALTDPLTGVLNRRGFNDEVARELARARRYGRPFVLAYVDVRGLKQVNDTEGHLAGDKLLQEVAGILTESARAADVVGRLGGDELGLLLTEQSTDGAAVVTERIRSQVPVRRAMMDIQAPWDLTIGVAAFPEDGETFDELLHVADRRLYDQRGIALPSEGPQPPANAPLS